MKSQRLLVAPVSLKDLPFALLTAYLVFIIFKQHQAIVFDQAFILRGLEPISNGWPIYDGLISKLIIQLIGGLFHPSAENINGVIRGFSCVFLMTSLYFILREYVESVILRYLALGLLIFSGYPLLWISVEVIGASFLLLFLFSWLKDFPPVVLAIFGVLFSLTRAELPLMTAALGLLIIVMSKKPKEFGIRFISLGIFIFFILNLPGVISHGFAVHFALGHALTSVCQHIAVMSYLFQLHSSPDPWGQWPLYKAVLMPHADSLKEVLTDYNEIYTLFVAGNIGMLLIMLTKVVHLILVPWLITFFRKTPLKNTEIVLRKAYLFLSVSFVGFIPIIFLASPHERYLLRFYVLFLVFAFIFLDRALIKMGKRSRIALYIIIFGLFFHYQGKYCWRALTHPGQYETYYNG